MKIHVDRFYSNNKEKKLEDIIKNIRIGVVAGVTNVHFETVDKYVMVEANGSLSTPDYKGEVISIKPYIYNENGDDLYEKDWNVYYEHPDYYGIELCVDGISHVTSVVIPLKHEYFVSFVPDVMCMNYSCLGETDITVWEK